MYLNHTNTAPFIDAHVSELRERTTGERRIRPRGMNKMLAAGLATLAIAAGIAGTAVVPTQTAQNSTNGHTSVAYRV